VAGEEEQQEVARLGRGLDLLELLQDADRAGFTGAVAGQERDLRLGNSAYWTRAWRRARVGHRAGERRDAGALVLVHPHQDRPAVAGSGGGGAWGDPLDAALVLGGAPKA
jgi:hypothetical protein